MQQILINMKELTPFHDFIYYVLFWAPLLSTMNLNEPQCYQNEVILSEFTHNIMV